ncbi:MAG: helix-turn-helix transcriptional regulator [Candidatus Dormibacteria bacterium]
MPRRTTPIGPFTSKLAVRVRELRKAHGWTQQQLAERAGLHLTHISAIERHLTMPSFETAAGIPTSSGIRLGQPSRRSSGIRDSRGAARALGAWVCGRVKAITKTDQT